MTDPFATIIGHERLVRRLRTMLERGAFPHAAVFHGPRHAGKTTLALAAASALLDLAPDGAGLGAERPQAHPDFRLIERPRDEKTGKLKKQIPIQAIREMQEHLRLSAFLGGAKVAVIDGADALSEEAANALLKTLEEPAARSYVLLCAEDLNRLPKTVLSRSALFELRHLPDAALSEALAARGLDAYEAARLAARADGRPGLALGFLERGDMLNWYETEERRWQALRGAPPHRRLAECAALAPARSDREETVERLRDVIDLWQGALRRELKAGEPTAGGNLRRLQTLRASLDANVQPRLLLEKFALTLQ